MFYNIATWGRLMPAIIVYPVDPHVASSNSACYTKVPKNRRCKFSLPKILILNHDNYKKSLSQKFWCHLIYTGISSCHWAEWCGQKMRSTVPQWNPIWLITQNLRTAVNTILFYTDKSFHVITYDYKRSF